MARVENEIEAKQGDKRRSTFVALIVGLVLAVTAGVGVLTWQGATSPSDPASSSLDAAREKAPAGAPGQSADPASPAPAKPNAQ